MRNPAGERLFQTALTTTAQVVSDMDDRVGCSSNRFARDGRLASMVRTCLALLAPILCLLSTLSPAKADPIFAISGDGRMFYYRFSGMADGSNTWAVEQRVIGTGWNGFSQVLSGGSGAVYGITPDGRMLFYRFDGMADGSNTWAVEQRVIGTGWHGFSRVFAGDRGTIYGVTPDGRMLFYRFAGLADGANRWAVEQKVIGTGWNGFTHVFAGTGGTIYAITPDGRMLFYRFAGMADGANRWAVEQKVIGTGWNAFRQVFAGENGALYGITPDGQMLFYRFAGMLDGANRWDVEQKVIGVGWQFPHIANSGGPVAGSGAPPVSQPPRPGTATPSRPGVSPQPARNNERCRDYARRARDDFALATGNPRCARMLPREPAGRWHNDFNVHYDWCARSDRGSVTAEGNQRFNLLRNCGASSRID